jgi:hypothetical protein
MKPGNQWNWTWAFLAIIIGFQSTTLFSYLGLPRADVDLGAMPFFLWSAMLAHGMSLTTGVLFRLARRSSTLTGYWNALPLSIIGVPANIIAVIMLARLIFDRPSFWIGVLGSLVFPGILMTIAFRDPTREESQQATATLPRVPLGG